VKFRIFDIFKAAVRDQTIALST